MANSTQEISENIKQARENALVGNYEESKVCYQGALQDVQKMLKATPDLEMKQKWKQANICSYSLLHYRTTLPLLYLYSQS